MARSSRGTSHALKKYPSPPRSYTGNPMGHKGLSGAYGKPLMSKVPKRSSVRSR